MSVCFPSFQVRNVYDFMIFISLTVRGSRGNPETENENTVSRCPANLRDEYFRLSGVQSRGILNSARAL